MASTIKVKRSTGTTPPSGLTFGELAYLDGLTSFYIGNSIGESITFGAEVDADNTLSADSDYRIATQKAVKAYIASELTGIGGNAFGQIGVVGQAGLSADQTNDVLNLATGTGITLSTSEPDTLTIGLLDSFTLPGTLTVGTDLVVNGDFTVQGTTTTVNVNTMTVDDPIIVLGTSGGTPIGSTDGNKDRGIAYTYYTSGGATGFFGFDASAERFTFIPTATDVDTHVVSGAPGSAEFLSVYFNNLSGNFGILESETLTEEQTWTLPDHTGTVVVPTNLGTADYVLKSVDSTSQPIWVPQSGLTVGNADKWTNSITLTLGTDLTGNVSFDGSSNVTLNATIAANSVELGTDTTGNYVRTFTTGSAGLTSSPSLADESVDITLSFTTIESGLNMGTFSFASAEFVNTSGTVSIGTIDGGSF